MSAKKQKQKRNFSPEARAAAAERMRKIGADYRARKAQEQTTSTAQSDVAVLEPAVPSRPPEVQAVIDSMTPERKAKLAQIQARQFQTREGQEALARHEAEKINLQTATQGSSLSAASAEQSVAVLDVPIVPSEEPMLPPARIGSREVTLLVRTDGTMVSQYGPCLCGAVKRQWHKICLKEDGDAKYR